MLHLHPENDLRLSYYYLGSRIISIVRKNKGGVYFEDVLELFLAEDERRTPNLFGETLIFLYALGIIDLKQNYFLKLESQSHKPFESELKEGDIK